jgi:glycosyltransferase involved in cell wall biosynthesis
MHSRRSSCSILHVLYWLRAEGTPRLVLELLREAKRQRGECGEVAVLRRDSLDLEPAFAELDIPIHDMWWERRRYDKLFWHAYRVLARTRPRGVICYSLGCHVPIGAAAAVLGIPFVVHVGTAPPIAEARTLKILRWQMLAGLPFTRIYVGCSDYVRQAIHQQYCLPWRKTARIYNGIPLDRFLAIRKNRAAQGDRLRVGMVASLEPSKDHATLLRAIARLKELGQPVRLSLVGAGSLAEALRQQTHELGIDDSVDFRGSVTDVPGELAQMDVFAYSAKPEEGMGIALVEALASGLPCVGSNVPACREVLRSGRLGTIVERQDPGLWAEALLAARQRPAASEEELSPFRIGTTLQEYQRALFAPWPPFGGDP